MYRMSTIAVLSADTVYRQPTQGGLCKKAANKRYAAFLEGENRGGIHAFDVFCTIRPDHHLTTPSPQLVPCYCFLRPNILLQPSKPAPEVVHTTQFPALVHAICLCVTVLRPDYYGQLDYGQLNLRLLNYIKGKTIVIMTLFKGRCPVQKALFDA